jgi:hypothetical protein
MFSLPEVDFVPLQPELAVHVEALEVDHDRTADRPVTIEVVFTVRVTAGADDCDLAEGLPPPPPPPQADRANAMQTVSTRGARLMNMSFDPLNPMQKNSVAPEMSANR